MQKQILTTVILITGFVVYQACNNNENKTGDENADTTQKKYDSSVSSNPQPMNNDLMAVMNSSMAKMENMHMTGDFDFDFGNHLIEHHNSAIEMSKIEISKGHDSQAREWAKKISDMQTKEVEQLKQIIAGYKVTDTSGKHNVLRRGTQKMQTQMQSMQMTGDTDKDFVSMMKDHHQNGIEMAKNELTYGKKTELRKMAQKSIEDQTKDVEAFKAWLSAHK